MAMQETRSHNYDMQELEDYKAYKERGKGGGYVVPMTKEQYHEWSQSVRESNAKRDKKK